MEYVDMGMKAIVPIIAKQTQAMIKKYGVPEALLVVMDGGEVIAKSIATAIFSQMNREVDMLYVKISKYDKEGNALKTEPHIATYWENRGTNGKLMAIKGQKYQKIWIIDDVIESGETMGLASIQAEQVAHESIRVALVGKTGHQANKGAIIWKLYKDGQWVRFPWEK